MVKVALCTYHPKLMFPVFWHLSSWAWLKTKASLCENLHLTLCSILASPSAKGFEEEDALLSRPPHRTKQAATLTCVTPVSHLPTVAGVCFSVGGLQSKQQWEWEERKERQTERQSERCVSVQTWRMCLWDQSFRENDKWDQQQCVDVVLPQWHSESTAACFAESLLSAWLPSTYSHVCMHTNTHTTARAEIWAQPVPEGESRLSAEETPFT